MRESMFINDMTEDQFDDYQEYIMDNADGECMICNGETLLEAAEAGYLLEEFLQAQTSTCRRAA